MSQDTLSYYGQNERNEKRKKPSKTRKALGVLAATGVAATVVAGSVTAVRYEQGNTNEKRQHQAEAFREALQPIAQGIASDVIPAIEREVAAGNTDSKIDVNNPEHATGHYEVDVEGGTYVIDVVTTAVEGELDPASVKLIEVTEYSDPPNGTKNIERHIEFSDTSINPWHNDKDNDHWSVSYASANPIADQPKQPEYLVVETYNNGYYEVPAEEAAEDARGVVEDLVMPAVQSALDKQAISNSK